MTVLTPPRHPVVDVALALARRWCAGHVIDGAPALRHAAQVAVTLDRHQPDAPPELIAAVLLHDAPEFAPADIDLDELLTCRFAPETARVVRALQREHEALAEPTPPEPDVDDPLTLWASAADKIVSLESVVARASLAGDQPGYWAKRAPFLRLVPYFRRFHTAATPYLPAGMAQALHQAVVGAEAIDTPHRGPEPQSPARGHLWRVEQTLPAFRQDGVR
jgi:hypothetical protein